MNQAIFISTVRQALDENKIRYNTEQNERGTVFIIVPIRGTNSIYDSFFALNEKENWVIFRSKIPYKIEEEYRREIGEYILRLNDFAHAGNFGMIYSTGDMYFETNLNLKFVQEILKEDVLSLMSHHIDALDFAFNGIYRIIFGNLTPEQAIDLLKN
jgi:hypothetical protein